MSYICWDRGRLHQVLDPDALQMPDAYFLATHVRRMLRQVDPKKPKIGLGLISPEEVLRSFLAPDARHRQAVVVGTSGAGKSRLVRWLAVHMPKTPELRVVLIQKVGTNLRGVLETILEGMEGPEFDAYRDRLHKAVAGLDARTAPEEILNQLQQSVGATSSLADETLRDEDVRETREILIEELPALLGDPQFRKAMREKTQIITELVHHAVGKDQGERERRETRRSFHEDDLAVQTWDITEHDVNRLARKMFRNLRSSPQWRKDAADWMNRNLDDALGRLLSFSREDLGLMLRDVRRTLADQGRELVLLIEDFAKLQGVDYALLDAMSVRPDNQEGTSLCRLRSIMAMTTGYYERIEQTFSGRIDFVVDVDADDGEDRERDVVSIAARHLNALRTRDDSVREWSEEALEVSRKGLSLPLLPSACSSCDLRESCHASFGAMTTADGDQVGLYPFTPHALQEMYARTRTEGPFNPRVLLGRVLRQSLVNYTTDIEHDTWPPLALVRDLGGPQMPPIRFNQLERDLGPDQAGRYDALFELYGDPQTLSGVPGGIFKAFGMREYETDLASASASPPDRADIIEQTPLPSPGTGVGRPGLPARERNLMDALDRWRNGEKLFQEVTNELRKLLYAQVKETITWNESFLGESFHAERTGRSFQQTSLNFEDQGVSHGNAPVVVVIPRSAVLGLQGAILFELHKSWDFEDGGIYQVEYAELLEYLGGEVKDKIGSQDGKASHDVAQATAELLLLNSLFCGELSAEFVAGRRGEDVALDLILKNEESPAPAGLHGQLTDLAVRIHQERRRLREILMSQIACAKGSNTESASMIDASRLRGTVQQMVKTWKPVAKLPASPLRDYRVVVELRQRVDRVLSVSLTEEAKTLQAELAELNDHIGSEVSTHKVKEAIRSVSEAAKNAALWRGQNGYDSFSRALDRVRATKLDPMRQKASDERIGEVRSVPLLFSSELRAEIAAGARFVEEADAFLTRTLDRVEQEIAALGDDSEMDKLAIVGIDSGLEEINSILQALSVNGADAGIQNA